VSGAPPDTGDRRHPAVRWIVRGVLLVGLVAGAPRATAVLAVLGYRLVSYWLPLLPGAFAYLHLRLHPNVRRKAISQVPSSE